MISSYWLRCVSCTCCCSSSSSSSNTGRGSGRQKRRREACQGPTTTWSLGAQWHCALPWSLLQQPYKAGPCPHAVCAHMLCACSWGGCLQQSQHGHTTEVNSRCCVGACCDSRSNCLQHLL
jgi:hypothetical protein